MTDTMPISPVADANRNVNPEWRRYLGQTDQAIKLLRGLIGDAGGVSELKARLEALQPRIAALFDIAVNPHERLVMWRGVNDNDGAQARFTHDLGTRHIWWQIRRLSDGALLAHPLDSEVVSHNETQVTVGLSASVLAGEVEAMIIGVISDRY